MLVSTLRADAAPQKKRFIRESREAYSRAPPDPGAAWKAIPSSRWRWTGSRPVEACTPRAGEGWSHEWAQTAVFQALTVLPILGSAPPEHFSLSRNSRMNQKKRRDQTGRVQIKQLIRDGSRDYRRRRKVAKAPTASSDSVKGSGTVPRNVKSVKPPTSLASSSPIKRIQESVPPALGPP